MTCSTCRFWRPFDAEDNDHYWEFPDAEGAEEVAVPPWGTCLREDEPGTPMFTNDASGYFARLRTRAEFRCSAHEASP